MATSHTVHLQYVTNMYSYNPLTTVEGVDYTK